MRFILFLVLLFPGVGAWGETAPATTTSEPPKSNVNNNSIEVLSKDFFNSKPDASKAGGNPRYDGGEPDYNSEQREQWLRTCEKYKNKDLETYRKCFQDEKAKSREALRQSFEEVERRQALPLKNTNPLLDEQQRKYNGQEDDE